MNENFPTNIESESNKTKRQVLVDLIREKGFENEETTSAFRDFLASISQKYSHLDNRFRQMLEIDKECARLYFEAGMVKESIYTFELIMMYAVKEKNLDLYESIKAEMVYLGLK